MYMKHRDRLWQHFVESGNPMSYIAYRQIAKREAARQLSLENYDAPHEDL
jgi:hypothetical protein